jgi:hypothetical protein
MSKDENVKHWYNSLIKKYGSKMNKQQVCTAMGISPQTFQRRINQNQLDELPKFKATEKMRKNGIILRKYQFSTLWVAEFLAEE